jgi:hypothetical protein
VNVDQPFWARDDSLIRRELVVRCAECERVTGNDARIGLVVESPLDDSGLIVSSTGVGSFRSENRSLSIEWVNGRASIRYFCRRCERRTGRIAYRVVSADWFRERFAEMAPGKRTRELKI